MLCASSLQAEVRYVTNSRRRCDKFSIFLTLFEAGLPNGSPAFVYFEGDLCAI